ncbi:MAG: prohibitin family protein [Campylobacteraceae bacterium]|nr:prohibitin family protein [Campylobacteraceae bacterium]
MPVDLNDYFKKKSGSGGGNNGGGGNNQMPNIEPPEFLKNLGKKAGFLYVLIAVIVILVISKPFVIINSGEMGIKATTGKFDPTPMNPGFHMFLPFIQSIFIVDTKVRVMNYTSAAEQEIAKRGSGIKNKNAISVLDSRGLPVSIDLTVQYKLEPASAPQTIATWGMAWEDKIINPVVRDVTRNVVGQYPAEELPLQRNAIAAKIDQQIRKNINAQPGQPVKLLTVQLRKIILPQKIKDQILIVQIAKQQVEKTKYQVEQANQEAQKKAALATGDANARKIKAKGQASAVRIEADANAYANIEIAKSITTNLLKLRQIEVQGQFNDALKVNKDAKIFLTPGGAVPNIWVDTKDTRKTVSASK